MFKKITGGVLSLILVGGLLFGTMATASAAYQTAAVSSDATLDERAASRIILKSAAEVLGMTTQNFVSTLKSSKIGGLKTLLSNKDMTIREFMPALQERVGANLRLIISQTQNNIAQSSYVQGYVGSLISTMQQRPALVLAFTNKALLFLSNRINPAAI